jgi:hypothetical protein
MTIAVPSASLFFCCRLLIVSHGVHVPLDPPIHGIYIEIKSLAHVLDHLTHRAHYTGQYTLTEVHR